jgi:hypothetical protein
MKISILENDKIKKIESDLDRMGKIQARPIAPII